MKKGYQVQRNSVEGSVFEKRFKSVAEGNGLKIIKNHLTGYYLPGGRFQVVESELDFKLMAPGKIGFFDMKSFQDDFFTFSDLKKGQIERAALYNKFQIPAGFIVWFKSIDIIVYIQGNWIEQKGERSRFTLEDGIFLGTFERFDVVRLLDPAEV